jgi:predicted nucleotidyltransferase
MRTVNDILPQQSASTLREHKRNVQLPLPRVEKLILFGSRPRGEARQDSDYDIADRLRAEAGVQRPTELAEAMLRDGA